MRLVVPEFSSREATSNHRTRQAGNYPMAEARKMADALKKRGKLYDFMVKADEGHGFHKESNRIEFARRADEFLKEYLQ